MDLPTTYLYEKLNEVFSRYELARVSLVQPASLERAVDLPQDYDPNQSDLHAKRGVTVRISGREFYFDASLVTRKNFAVIDNLIEEALKWLESQQD